MLHRSLDVDHDPFSPSPDVTMHIVNLLHHLETLTQMNLNGVALDVPLLTAIHRHSLPTVILQSSSQCKSPALASFGQSSLAKISIAQWKVDGRGDIEDHFRYHYYGMQIRKITLSELAFVVHEPEIFRSRFPRLCELEIILGPVTTGTRVCTLSWLPAFAQRNPLLGKISFKVISNHAIDKLHPENIFIQSFIEEIFKEGLADSLDITNFDITRAIPDLAPRGFSEWSLTGLHLKFYDWSSGMPLYFVHLFFPHITMITLEELSAPYVSHLLFSLLHFPITYLKDELVTSLSRFPALQIVSFVRPFKLLDFKNRTPGPGEMEAAIIQYTSRIAQRIPTIQAFFIHKLRGKFYDIRGWLDVQTLYGKEGRHTVDPPRYLSSRDCSFAPMPWPNNNWKTRYRKG